MIFSSVLFLFRFLPFVLLIYYIAPRKCRNLVLFIMSLVFYAWGEPKYVLIMIFSTIVDFVHGRLVGYYKEKNEITKAKAALISSIIINLLILSFFKYFDMIIKSVNYVVGGQIHLLEIALPIGISFYTFQTMSYTIDVYRGLVKPQKNIISFGAYVALFPQLIAGPIVQYKTIAAELDNRVETIKDFSYGINRFIIGLGKKVLLANNMGILWDTVKNMGIGNLPVLTAWLGIIAFSFQIYFDFSGYSDMAIGLGNMFGFHFNENFNYPYISKSITEFWRRWHISLGTWFREYVYIPLGGNRVNKWKFARNIAVIWFLTGLWHGANYNFIAWGLYFAVILVIEKIWLGKRLEKIPNILSHIYALFLIVIGWVIFSFENMKVLFEYIKDMFGLNGQSIYDNNTIYLFYTNIIIFCAVVIGSTPLIRNTISKIREKYKNLVGIDIILTNLFYIIVLILCISYLVSGTYNPFLYLRF